MNIRFWRKTPPPAPADPEWVFNPLMVGLRDKPFKSPRALAQWLLAPDNATDGHNAHDVIYKLLHAWAASERIGEPYLEAERLIALLIAVPQVEHTFTWVWVGTDAAWSRRQFAEAVARVGVWLINREYAPDGEL